MPDVTVANHVFLPWVQPGVASNIPTSSTDKLGTTVQPSVLTMQVGVVINTEAPITKTLRLYGPGDVTGIDPHQVVRTEPKARATDFEPNYFAAIEFDRPDFPWLFTPLKADAQQRLRPWLCLVVVRKQQGVELKPPSGTPLPSLSILLPAKLTDELPDLAESWAWAHAQLTGTEKDRAKIKTAIDTDPTRNVSRLLCPRRLEPSTDYIACVVPTFAIGVKAGLGSPVLPADETKLDPAWPNPATPGQATLPVYYSWEFRTGVGGDFEELVRRLEPRELPPEVGKRPMNVIDPGFPFGSNITEATPGALLGLEGALRVLPTKADTWAAETRVPFQNVLMPILNLPWQFSTGQGPGTSGDPIVGPPIYGCWYSGKHEVTTVPPPPLVGIAGLIPQPLQWFNELNTDPRHRVAAGLGTQVVQSQQEQLMASAWAQLGEIQKINQRRRQAQLSRSINDRTLLKRFSAFSDDAFFKIVSPAQARIVIEERPSPTAPPVSSLLIGKMMASSVPPAVTSAPLRKILRPRGAIQRQYTMAQVSPAIGMMAFFNTTPPAPVVQDRSGFTVDRISDSLPTTNPLRAKCRVPSFFTARVPLPANVVAFSPAAAAHQSYLFGVFFTFDFPIFFGTPLNPPNLRVLTSTSLTPTKVLANAVSASMTVASPPLMTGDPLDQVMDAPSFPQPMYEALRDLSQDYLLPGLEHVPPNTLQLLQTNAKFIESFMVGLNVEMGRELLWRDYPTDQRGTYFQQFWDTASAGAAPALDIRDPIHKWGARALGTTAVAGGDKVVLLIRGELLRRYPNTVIYAVRAVGPLGARTLSKLPADEVHPIFRGSLEPDVTFLGFNLTPAEVVAGSGWFFVLQQQPTEPRFGMDDDPFGPGEDGIVPVLKTWNDLNWAHIGSTPAALKAISHVSVKKITLTPTTTQLGTWGRNSAHMAYITKQLPTRVAIHATEMLPTPSVALPR